jgi:uncharacterized protein YjbI with pentapeptide repeats
MHSLQQRWTKEWKLHHESVTSALASAKDLSQLSLPATGEGLIDLRGYFSPKVTAQKTGKRQVNPVVLESTRIRKVRFENMDLSSSDFEGCEFHSCHFDHCKFDKARLRATRFFGCTFRGIQFQQTDIGDARFETSGILFPRRKINFNELKFVQCNFTHTEILSQGLSDCRFDDCKMGQLTISGCELIDISFIGYLHDLFIINNKAKNVSLNQAHLSGVSFTRQSLKGFELPHGPGYYQFQEKEKEIDWLSHQAMSIVDKELFAMLRVIWLQKDSGDFVDIHYLKPEELESGHRLLKMLQEHRR